MGLQQTTLQRIRALNLDTVALDELIEIVDVHAKPLRAAHETRNIPVPEELLDGINRINREIDLRSRDDLEKMLKEAKARRAALLTADEKRKAADEEIARLEGKLGHQRETQPA
jgi:hypothetical protein